MPAAGSSHEATPLYAWLAPLLPVGLFVWFASFTSEVSSGAVFTWIIPWIPQIEISFGLRVDGLSLLFALMITGIGACILLYCTAYMRGAAQLDRFTLWLVLFMLAMLGLVLAADLITLFVFWELTTLTSFMLIGYDHENQKARRAALQGLIVTGTGGLIMLAGFIMLGQVVGSYAITDILAGGSLLRAHPDYHLILVLILAGAFTKSAQFPFHFWLPNAMAAPTPVSAYLHSATMVKAGVFLLARLNPALGDTYAWMVILTVFGAVTAIYASLLALRQRDLKQMLAYTTIMALGVCVMFLGAASEIGLISAVTFVLVHALYKAALFLVVGILDHETGTRDIDALSGLWRTLPFTSVAALLASLSMAGMPPFIGFVGKELLYKAALAWPPEPVVAIATIVVAKVLMVTVALMLFASPFFGEIRPTPKSPHEPPLVMWFGPLLLGVVALLGGLVPDFAGERLLLPAAGAVMQYQPDYNLALWHGINLPLVLSMATFAVGGFLYVFRLRLVALLDRLETALPTKGDRLYDVAMSGLVGIAEWQTSLLQNGLRRNYVRVVFATLAVAVGGTLLLKGGLALPDDLNTPTYYDWAVVILILMGTAATVLADSRLLAICALGVVGIGVALIFLMFSAPDVALTQLLVETLVIVIAARVLLALPSKRYGGKRSSMGRMIDFVIAIAVGATVTGTLLAVTAVPPDRTLTEFFESRSVPGGFGRNIVNVILVDFRAFDTFGEVAVVVMAGLASYALIRLRPGRDSSRNKDASDAEDNP